MTDKKSAEVRTEETVRAARRPWRRPEFVVPGQVIRSGCGRR